MKIVNAYPPNIDAIDAVFNVRGKPILYAWGDIVYQPHPDGDEPIASELRAHEREHGQRQLSFMFSTSSDRNERIAVWWERYLADQAFRLDEEVHAHRAELQHLLDKYPSAGAAWKRQATTHVASRLRAELYRYEPRLEFHKARRLLLPKAA